MAERKSSGTPRHLYCAQPIGADHFPVGLLDRNQVMAGRVELVTVASGLKRRIQSLLELEIENFKTKLEGSIDLLNIPCQANHILRVRDLNFGRARNMR